MSVLLSVLLATDPFPNWESAPVHSVAVTDAGEVLVCNVAQATLEIFSAATPPVWLDAVPVGLDPVSVRVRPGTREAWVVNHVSDSVSVIDLDRRVTTAVLSVLDEPGDVVFAGSPERAYVSCTTDECLLVFDPNNLNADPGRIDLLGEEPKALAVDPSGQFVYAAFLCSGNRTTVLAGGGDFNGSSPPNVVSDPATPYGGQNPPPNAGDGFMPSRPAGQPTPPKVGLIVRGLPDGSWVDDNGTDWSEFVSGSQAFRSGRPTGWDLLDHDLAIVDTLNNNSVSYVGGALSLVTGVAVHPNSGDPVAIGIESFNEIRFEPVLEGVFAEVRLARWGTEETVVNLNPHTEGVHSLPPAERAKSVGDPRSIVFSSDGEEAWIASKGSNNVLVVDPSGQRMGDPIPVGFGSTGLALTDEVAYVHNHFEGSLAVVDRSTREVAVVVSLFDPVPDEVQQGRAHMYDTHLHSARGEVSCATCHIDSRMDRLAWDLGNPGGSMQPIEVNCNMGVDQFGPDCPDFHPMKGPMTTQTMQDLIGKEPLHWRGDRLSIEAFDGAFHELLGGDEPLNPIDMGEMRTFLSTVRFPPNPYRNVDNTLPTDLEIPFPATGRYASAGSPMPNGNALRGLDIYTSEITDDPFSCVTCHALPTGMGPDRIIRISPPGVDPIPLGPNQERHHAVVSVDGSTQRHFKVPQLRNMYKKTGFDLETLENTSGFGYLHDGSVDTLVRFFAEPLFDLGTAQRLSDVLAMMFAFSGSEFPGWDADNPFDNVVDPGLDTHAGVGRQVAWSGVAPPEALDMLNAFTVAAANSERVELMASIEINGRARGAVLSGETVLLDGAGQTMTVPELLNRPEGTTVVVTLAPAGHAVRLVMDRDGDGVLNHDEWLAGSDPRDPNSVPVPCPTDLDGDGNVGFADVVLVLSKWGACDACPEDLTGEGTVDFADLLEVLSNFGPC